MITWANRKVCALRTDRHIHVVYNLDILLFGLAASLESLFIGINHHQIKRLQSSEGADIYWVSVVNSDMGKPG